MKTTTRSECDLGDGDFDHDWEFVDDSFDHEFGTERVWYWRCKYCHETKEMESGDYFEPDYYDE